MSAPERPTCQACGTQYQSTWRWCLACGDDPDGLAPPPLRPVDEPVRPEAAAPRAPAAPTPAGTTGLVGTRPAATTATTASPGPTKPKQHARRKGEQVLAEAKADGPWSLALIAIIGVLLAGGVYLYRVRSASSADPAMSSASPSTAPIEWANFQPDDRSFTVELPGQPFVNTTDATLAGAPASRTEYLTLAGNANVGVSVTAPKAPTAAPVTAAELDAFATEIAARVNARVTDTTPIDFNGSPGLDYVIDINGVGQNRGRLISAGPRIYNLYVVAAQPDLADLERITTSFVPS